MIYGYVSSTGAVTLIDCWSNNKGQPVQDTKSDITVLSGSDNGGVTTIKFQRLLSTGDTTQDVDLSGMNSYSVQWAYALGESLSEQHSDRGLVLVNFAGGTAGTLPSTTTTPSTPVPTAGTNSFSAGGGAFTLTWGNSAAVSGAMEFTMTAKTSG
jgi:hypothetical protein